MTELIREVTLDEIPEDMRGVNGAPTNGLDAMAKALTTSEGLYWAKCLACGLTGSGSSVVVAQLLLNDGWSTLIVEHAKNGGCTQYRYYRCHAMCPQCSEKSISGRGEPKE